MQNACQRFILFLLFRLIQQGLKFVTFGQSSPNPAGTLRANCVCRALVAYMKATRHIRRGDQLFVTYKQGDQGWPASKATIATWFKAVIAQAYSDQGKALAGSSCPWCSEEFSDIGKVRFCISFRYSPAGMLAVLVNLCQTL